MGRRDRGAGGRGDVEHRGRRGLGREPLGRVEVDDPPAQGAHDPPAAGVRPEAEDDRRQGEAHAGIDSSPAARCPLAMSASATTPAVFDASCIPCPNAIAAADTVCAYRNPRAVGPGLAERNSHRMTAITTKPPTIPTTGDRSIGTTTLSRMLSHFTVAPPASAAPPSPPMRACDDDEGRPRHQVSMFQAVAPTRAPGADRDAGPAHRHLDDVAADRLRHAHPDERRRAGSSRPRAPGRSAGSAPGSSPTSRWRWPRRGTRSCT